MPQNRVARHSSKILRLINRANIKTQDKLNSRQMRSLDVFKETHVDEVQGCSGLYRILHLAKNIPGVNWPNGQEGAAPPTLPASSE